MGFFLIYVISKCLPFYRVEEGPAVLTLCGLPWKVCSDNVICRWCSQQSTQDPWWPLPLLPMTPRDSFTSHLKDSQLNCRIFSGLKIRSSDGCVTPTISLACHETQILHFSVVSLWMSHFNFIKLLWWYTNHMNNLCNTLCKILSIGKYSINVNLLLLLLIFLLDKYILIRSYTSTNRCPKVPPYQLCS